MAILTPYLIFAHFPAARSHKFLGSFNVNFQKLGTVLHGYMLISLLQARSHLFPDGVRKLGHEKLEGLGRNVVLHQQNLVSNEGNVQAKIKLIWFFQCVTLL